MITELDVKAFLNEFKAYASISKIIYAIRKTNTETLLELGIAPSERDRILKDLEVLDYSQGPLTNDQYGNNSMWVFGRIIKGEEIYIKITCSQYAYCISFHIAEHPMNYPFRIT